MRSLPQKPLRIGISLAPQRTTIDELRAVWRLADEAGFDSCWTSDNFAASGPQAPRGDIFECWTLLAAMAEGTQRVRIGCMVAGNTYRHPAVVAKMAVTIDHLSGGRLDVGLGAGDDEPMLGLEFGSVASRMDRLDEAGQVITSLWTETTTTFAGTYYRLTDAASDPKPVQRPHPPLWIGGTGRKRTLRIAAKYAAGWNMPRGTVADFNDLTATLDHHCTAIGRDPATVERSTLLRFAEDPKELLPAAESFAHAGANEVIVMLRPDQADAAEKVAAILPRLRSID